MVPGSVGPGRAEQKPALAPPDFCSRLRLGTTGSQALSDPGLGLGAESGAASSLCEIMATPIYRTLNLGGLKFVHLLLWQSWENWATFLVLPVTLSVTLGMFSAPLWTCSLFV